MLRSNDYATREDTILYLRNVHSQKTPFAKSKICCTTYKNICIYQKKVVPLYRQIKTIHNKY